MQVIRMQAQEAPLILSRHEEDGGVLGGTYKAPIVPERHITSSASLPTNPKEREEALQKWADDLSRWQASLEGHSNSSSGSTERVPNWPPLLRFWRYDVQELPAQARTGMRRVYWLFLVEVLVALYNAVTLCIVRGLTDWPADADIAWAFMLVFLVGSVASFAILRSIYTALRKLRRLLMLESLVWITLQVVAELWLAAGVPGTGSAGFFFVFEVLSDAPIVAVLLAIAGALWLLCAVLHVITWFWLRKMAAEMRRAVSADDAYRRFEEPGGEAAVFATDDIDGDGSDVKSTPVSDSPPRSVAAVDAATQPSTPPPTRVNSAPSGGKPPPPSTPPPPPAVTTDVSALSASSSALSLKKSGPKKARKKGKREDDVSGIFE